MGEFRNKHITGKCIGNRNGSTYRVTRMLVGLVGHYKTKKSVDLGLHFRDGVDTWMRRKVESEKQNNQTIVNAWDIECFGH